MLPKAELQEKLGWSRQQLKWFILMALQKPESKLLWKSPS
jgi:hypothetical protein